MSKRIIVIGLGGIGSFLTLVLARYLNFSDGCKNLVLVDGDNYDRGNLKRQNISLQDSSKNKAEVQTTNLRSLFNTLSIIPIPEFVTEKNMGEIIDEDSLVFLAVDNHATRRIVSDHCKRLQDIVLISGGNERDDGNIQIYHRKNGRARTPPLEKFHPEIEFPEDQNPAELSCEELAEIPGSEQIIFTNLMAACLMLNAFHSIVTYDFVRYVEVYFDIDQNKATPRQR